MLTVRMYILPILSLERGADLLTHKGAYLMGTEVRCDSIHFYYFVDTDEPSEPVTFRIFQTDQSIPVPIDNLIPITSIRESTHYWPIMWHLFEVLPDLKPEGMGSGDDHPL